MNRKVQALAFTALFAVALSAAAQNTLAGSPFVDALKDGKTKAPPPPGMLTDFIVRKIQAQTGSSGELVMEVYRVARFKTQPACGRVLFGLYQPSTNTFWGQMGGQLNVCEDGTPPLKMCKGKPDQLVLPSHVCADKSRPVETPEVAAAIAKALSSGGMTIEQFRNSILNPTKPTDRAKK